MAAAVFNSTAIGLGFSINLYIQTFFWEFRSDQIALFTFASLTAALLAFASAARVSQRFGKKPSAMGLIFVSMLLTCLPIVLRLMGAFPENGSPALFPLVFGLSIISVGLGITGNILLTSMIADVVEDSELRTGRRSEGLFFAANAFVAKAVTGIGIFVSSILLTGIGFPDGARPGEVAPEVVRNLGLVVAPTLAILYGTAVAILIGYRITRASHLESLRRLAAAADLAAEGEPPGSTSRLS